jgi:hypothetical protein
MMTQDDSRSKRKLELARGSTCPYYYYLNPPCLSQFRFDGEDVTSVMDDVDCGNGRKATAQGCVEVVKFQIPPFLFGTKTARLRRKAREGVHVSVSRVGISRANQVRLIRTIDEPINGVIFGPAHATQRTIRLADSQTRRLDPFVFKCLLAGQVDSDVR